jgi:hypothetical protein
VLVPLIEKPELGFHFRKLNLSPQLPEGGGGGKVSTAFVTWRKATTWSHICIL